MYTILAGLLLQQFDFIHQLSPEFLSLLQDRRTHSLGKRFHVSHACREVVEKVLGEKNQVKSLLFKRDHTPTSRSFKP